MQSGHIQISYSSQMELYKNGRNIEQSVSADRFEHKLATHGLAGRSVIVIGEREADTSYSSIYRATVQL
jgi:hypothetical protein